MSAVPKRLKRVSWAPEAELRQERLFLSEDAPAISGFGIKDHLKAKSSSPCHSTALVSGEPLPSGPEALHPSKKHKDASQIPLIKWKCPNKLVLNSQWMVVAGEDSTEVQTQIQRQLGTLEAIYPRLTSIPANPFVSSKEEDCNCDDSATSIVPLTAIEDNETGPSCSTVVDDCPKSGQPNVPEKLPMDGTPQLTVRLPHEQIQENTSPAVMEKQRCECIPGVEPDIAAAASAVYTAIMKINDEGNMIDRELLIEILSDPTAIEKLISDAGAPKQSSPQAMSPASLPSLCPPRELCHGAAPLPAPPPPPLLCGTSSDAAEFTTGKPVREAGEVKDPDHRKDPMPQRDGRDVTYLKRLIRQHGGEGGGKEGRLNLSEKHKQRRFGARGRQGDACNRRDFKPRNSVPCAFFNSPKGCKNGSKCMFLHDML